MAKESSRRKHGPWASIDDDISTMDTEERTRIEDKNKKFLYARAVHATHMIQHHMHEISERRRVKSDLVINQHIMQMIDTDIFWYGETFKSVLMELQKIRHGETTMKVCEKLD